MSKQDIIDKILFDAQTEAEKTVKSAREKAEQNLAVAREKAEKYFSEEKAKTLALCAEIAEKKQAQTRLDANKLTLKAKREILEEVYKLAGELLLKGSNGELYKFFVRLIEENAKEGDEVLIGGNLSFCEKVKGEKFFKEKNLVLSEKLPENPDEIILSGEKTDTALSIKALLEEDKNEYLGEIALKLFEGSDE